MVPLCVLEPIGSLSRSPGPYVCLYQVLDLQPWGPCSTRQTLFLDLACCSS